MSVRRLIGSAVLAASLALAGSSGCMLGPRGPSAVAQGRYFSTGDPNYDEFFLRLHRMQVELKAAPETLAGVRSELTRSLALEANADTEALRRALKTKAGEVNARGATLALERAREPEARVRLAVLGTPASSDRELVKTFGESVDRVAEVRGRLGAWQDELEWLPPAGVALDGRVEAAFIGQSRGTRDEVHENLVDAQKVVALMAERTKAIDTESAELERIFASAFAENRSEAPPAPAPEPEPAAKPRRSARHGEPRPSAAPDDAAPSPAKPKQGTAKPDFEP
ncbi:MAG TPA: hypothetical protein VFZ53_04405 [Polyangiaceae bacterium]